MDNVSKVRELLLGKDQNGNTIRIFDLLGGFSNPEPRQLQNLWAYVPNSVEPEIVIKIVRAIGLAFPQLTPDLAIGVEKARNTADCRFYAAALAGLFYASEHVPVAEAIIFDKKLFSFLVTVVSCGDRRNEISDTASGELSNAIAVFFDSEKHKTDYVEFLKRLKEFSSAVGTVAKNSNLSRGYLPGALAEKMAVKTFVCLGYEHQFASLNVGVALALKKAK